jgi:hypothetical protein
VTRLRAVWRVRSPEGARKGFFYPRHRVQTGSGAYPASYPIGTGGSFPGGKVACSCPLPFTSAKVKNAWNHTCIPQYVFVALYLVKHKESFILPLRDHPSCIADSEFILRHNYKPRSSQSHTVPGNIVLHSREMHNWQWEQIMNWICTVNLVASAAVHNELICSRRIPNVHTVLRELATGLCHEGQMNVVYIFTSFRLPEIYLVSFCNVWWVMMASLMSWYSRHFYEQLTWILKHTEL